MAARKRRDRHGRYRGNGGIKPYKSNLPKTRGKTVRAGKRAVRPNVKAVVKSQGVKGPGWSGKKKVAVAGVAAIAITGVAVGSGIVAQRALKEKALKEKYGKEYIPKNVTGYHYTSGNGGRSILREQQFKSKQRYGLHGTPDGIWFTNQKDQQRKSMEDQYGSFNGSVSVVKTKFKRKAIEKIVVPNYDDNSKGQHKWFRVNVKDLRGSKIKPVRTQSVAPSTIARAKRVAKAKGK